MCLQFKIVSASRRDLYPFGVHDFTIYRRKLAMAFEPVLLMHMLLHERGRSEGGELSLRLGPDWQEVCRQHSPGSERYLLDCQLAREGFGLEPTASGGLVVSMGARDVRRAMERRCGADVAQLLLSPLDGGALSATSACVIADVLERVKLFHFGRVRIGGGRPREITFNAHSRTVGMFKRCRRLNSALAWGTTYGSLPFESRPISGAQEGAPRAA